MLRKITHSILFILFLTISSSLWSQTVIKGKTIDAKSRKPLPFCTIYFEGKKIGTKSDNFGNFTIKSPNNEKTLYASYLGFQTQTIKVNGDDNNLVINLVEAPRKTKETVIKGKRKLEKDTLAVRIIRNVIKNKENNRPSAYKSLEYNKYIKFEVDIANLDSVTGTNFISKPLKYLLEYQSKTPDGQSYSPILFRETYQKVFEKGSQKKIQILGIKDTKMFDNESIFSLLEYAFESYSIYDNQIIIANKSLTGPAADFALVFYRYYVDDSTEVDGVKNYHMTFAPSSKEDFGFTGRIIVEEGTWAIKEAQLRLDKRANINWINHFALEQEFKKIGSKWFTSKEEKDIALSVSKTSKTSYKLRFRQAELYDNIKADQELDENIFVGEETDYSTGYRKVNDSFWQTRRLEELNDFEKGIYVRADSFKKTRQYRTLKYLSRVVSSAYLPIPPINWEVGRLYQILSWNEYQGTRLRLGARTTFDVLKDINVSGYMAYGTKDKKINFGGEVYYNFPRVNRRWNQLYFAAISDYQRIGDFDNLLNYDNIVQSIFRNPNNAIKDIIKKDEVRVVWTKEWQRGLQSTLGFNRSVYYANSLYQFNEKLRDGSVVNREDVTTTRILASLRIAPKEPVFQNEFNRVRLRSIRPVVTLTSLVGIKGLWGSEFGFMKLKANIIQSVPTVFGQFRYNLSAGKVFGRVPYIDLEYHAGNGGYLRDDSRYYLMNEGEYVSDMYAQVWASQHFQGFFLNKVPLLKKLGWREMVFLKSLIGSIDERNKNYFVLPNNINAPSSLYAETGFGITNIFKFIEVHFAWRLTQLDKSTSTPFRVLFGANFEL